MKIIINDDCTRQGIVVTLQPKQKRRKRHETTPAHRGPAGTDRRTGRHRPHRRAEPGGSGRLEPRGGPRRSGRRGPAQRGAPPAPAAPGQHPVLRPRNRPARHARLARTEPVRPIVHHAQLRQPLHLGPLRARHRLAHGFALSGHVCRWHSACQRQPIQCPPVPDGPCGFPARSAGHALRHEHGGRTGAHLQPEPDAPSGLRPATERRNAGFLRFGSVSQPEGGRACGSDVGRICRASGGFLPQQHDGQPCRPLHGGRRGSCRERR